MHNALFHWNINPVLASAGPLAIRWYGIFFATAFISGFILMRWIYQNEELPATALDPLLWYMIVGTIVGARLGHCFLYDPAYYLSRPFEILKIWEGGLASHGGALGILLSLFIYTRSVGRPSYLWLLDRVAIPAALGGFFIRIGNFFNSEIIGTPTSGWWAVVFESVDLIPRHAVQLYEAIAYGLIFFFLFFLYRCYGKNIREGLLLGVFFVSVFTVRLVLEFVKTPQEAYAAPWIFSVGQWLSVPFIVLGSGLLAHSLKSAEKNIYSAYSHHS
jgi:phosphatidylglycerol---prolipoprotein diacylglyceryl transferase